MEALAKRFSKVHEIKANFIPMQTLSAICTGTNLESRFKVFLLVYLFKMPKVAKKNAFQLAHNQMKWAVLRCSF